MIERKHLSTREAAKVMAEAQAFFLAERNARRNGLKVLADAGLLYDLPSELEPSECKAKPEAGVELEDTLQELDELIGGNGLHANPNEDLAGKEIYISRLRYLERTSKLYPLTVEIIFPPRVVEDYGLHGVILPIYDVLLARIAQIEGKEPSRADLYRKIVEKYYSNQNEAKYDLEFDD